MSGIEGRPGDGPVFLHSSFRTCSTWLWIRFRDNPRTLAFNEYFNEMLADLTLEVATRHGSGSWSSGHPETAPYFLEFAPLIRAEGKGVRHFEPAMAIGRLIPDGGVRGALSAVERRYVGSLIAHAEGLGRTPVLSCTRPLGRVSGLKQAFGGVHVFLCRNLFQQWNSYVHQHDNGNGYFIYSILGFLAQGGKDAFMAKVRDGLHAQAQALKASQRPDGGWDALFTAFMAVHLYLSMIAWDAADLVLDANRLAADPAHRAGIEAEILALTGLAVDLGDASVGLQATQKGLLDPEATWRAVGAAFEAAAAHAAVTPAAQAFGQTLLAEARREHDAYVATRI